MNTYKNRNKYRLLNILFNLYEFLNYLIDYLTTKKNKKNISTVRVHDKSYSMNSLWMFETNRLSILKIKIWKIPVR